MKISSIIIAFVLLMLGMSYGRADDKAVEKYKNYMPEQIRSLSEKEKNSEVPMGIMIAAQRGLAPDAKLAITSDLNTLMYPAINEYDKSVKAFQVDLGEKPTGVLTVWQISKLQQRAEIQRLTPIGFPQNYSSYISDDSAHITGTVTMLGDKIAWPINHVVVDCYKRDAYCEYRLLVLLLPTDNDFAQIYSISDLGRDVYKITRWENGEIDAVPAGDSQSCRTTSLNYNFKTKEFFETTRNTDKKCEILGKVFEKLPKPRISQIVDGKEIIQNSFAEIQKKAYGFLSSDFRKQVDGILAAVAKPK